MRKRNNKLIKTMLLGSLAFVMMTASRVVLAQELSVYKCYKANGQIVYQDVGCSDRDLVEVLNIRFNNSADVDPGLRAQENIAQKYAFQRQMLEISKRS